MKKSTWFATLLAAALAMPAFAQNEPVVISGSLIDWYYYGKDYTGSTSGEGWHQQSTGGAWIDENGVAHSTGESNYGLISLYANGNSTQLTEGGLPTLLVADFPIRNHILYSNCGGVWMGGNEYYSFFGHDAGFGGDVEEQYGSEDYEILVRKWTWDVDPETGAYTNVQYQQVGTLSNQPTDLAYDPEEDIVYGVFYTGEAYKLGILDMNTFKVKWISREAMSILGELRTLACNSKGELYGTDKSGYIYHVDKTDGRLTTIGHMGFESQELMMSATFDYRTDKMYWIGYTNNGKSSTSTGGSNTTMTVAEGGRDTGIYEIDVENGTATLLSSTDSYPTYEIVNGKPVLNWYGKMQLTGIYVEGSITKYDKDLKVSFDSYPEQLKEGSTGEVKVIVKNMGTSKVRGRFYTVSLYADGQLVGTIDQGDEDSEVWTEDLEAGAYMTYSFTYTVPNKQGDCKLKAVVEYSSDERLKNNTAEVTVNILKAHVHQSLTLTKVKETGNTILMTWNEIDGQITEGAEDYLAFSYDDLCDWTMVDGDKGFTQKPNNWNSSVNYPNWNTPKAFIVMNPVKAGLSPDVNVGGEKLMPHSGDQYFAGFYSVMRDDSDSAVEIDNDDYMVSPMLNGEAQTISFWAKGYRGAEQPGVVTEMSFNETLEVLYTTDADNLDPTTYEVAVEEFTVNDLEWEQYTADLPAGAKHFALHRTSKASQTAETDLGTVNVPGTGSFIMMIDDISFRIKGASSYHVYRNNELVKNTTGVRYSGEQVNSGDRFWIAAVDEDGNEFVTSNVIVFKAEDVNGDGMINSIDIIAVINAIKNGETTGAADLNGDGRIDIADIIVITIRMQE